MGTGVWDIYIETSKKEKEEKKSDHVSNLLKDFLNLKVGGLLPHPLPERGGVTIKETLEWTVVVLRSLEEGGTSRSHFQQATPRGGLGPPAVLWHHMHGEEHPVEETHQQGML